VLGGIRLLVLEDDYLLPERCGLLHSWRIHQATIQMEGFPVQTYLRELLLFLIVYTLLGVIYRQLMSPAQKELFESVVKYFDAFLNLIPLSFVLGFYVSYVASRWWQQFLAIPWPDKLFHSIACYVEGFDEESRMLRRSLMRYMNLALILVLRSISSAVKQRFPTLDHVVEAGFMTPTEKELFSAVPANEFNTYWVPCTWFVYRLQEATKRGKLLNQYSLENIMREFCEFRAKCGLLWCYDWVSIPMVYTQVVTLATYVFFIFTIIGRQKIDGFNVHKAMRSGRIPLDIDLYIPIFTILQFFFYMGLLKVAEQLINPFGDDDEDFELNWLIDRHVKASFLGCDILMNPERIPPMVKDYYWDKQDCPIPYTEASMHFKKKTYRGSADEIKALAAAITQAQMQRVHGTRGEIPYGAPGDRGGADYRREEAVSHQPAPRSTGSVRIREPDARL